MITGELKSKIDRLWDAFWSGGISDPLEVDAVVKSPGDVLKIQQGRSAVKAMSR